jgi:hypothetical protein
VTTARTSWPLARSWWAVVSENISSSSSGSSPGYLESSDRAPEPRAQDRGPGGDRPCFPWRRARRLPGAAVGRCRAGARGDDRGPGVNPDVRRARVARPLELFELASSRSAPSQASLRLRTHWISPRWSRQVASASRRSCALTCGGGRPSVGVLFAGVPAGSSDDELRKIAPQHAAFRINSACTHARKDLQSSPT